MELYHNSKIKGRYTTKEKLKIEKRFKYELYINILLETAANEISNGVFKSSYIEGNKRNLQPRIVSAHYLGNGIHCFDNFDDAKRYQDGDGEVIKFTVNDNSLVIYDLNSDANLIKLDEYLDEMLEAILIQNQYDESDKENFTVLIKELKRELSREFQTNPIAAGIILFFYFQFSLPKGRLKDKLPDITKCDFKEKSENKIYYCLNIKDNLLDLEVI